MGWGSGLESHLWSPYSKKESRRHPPNPSGAPTGGDQSQAGLLPVRGQGWQGLMKGRVSAMTLSSVLRTVHGHPGPPSWLLFAAGGSSFLACPTTCTSPVTALLSGEIPTGLSKALRGPCLADPWALLCPHALYSRCPAPALYSFPQVEWLYSRIPDSHQL